MQRDFLFAVNVQECLLLTNFTWLTEEPQLQFFTSISKLNMIKFGKEVPSPQSGRGAV